MLELRPYQKEAIEAIEEGLVKGINKPVLVLATGLGKTVIFCHVIIERHKKTGKKALIIAHREELLTQAAAKLLSIDPNLKVGIEMADQKVEPDVDVVIASVATLGRALSARIKKFDPREFDTIVIDEAHHASASTYKNVLKHFGVLKGEKTITDEGSWEDKTSDWNKDCLLLGVTATPSRNDNQGIDQIFDEVVYNYGIVQGIQNAWLSRVRAYRVDTKTSLEGVRIGAGDFAQDELANAINNPERNDLIVKTYMEKFDKKQALVFAIDREHMNALYLAFSAKGIQCAPIDGTTQKDLRKEYLDLFHQKKIHVIVNCMVLTEGYDNDTIDVIMMARPTKSGILYSQMVGRGTRTHHEKPYLTIVDFVDNLYRHTIRTSASLIGVEGMVNFQGNDIVDAKDQVDKIRELAPGFNLDKLDFDKLDYIMEEVDLMGGLDIPDGLKGITDHGWLKYGEDAYRLGIGNNQYFVVQLTLTGQWKATLEKFDKLTKKESIEELGEEKSLEFIIKRCDQYILSNYADALILINMHARWRKANVSEAQEGMLRRMGVSQLIIDQLDKGKATQLISKLINAKTKRYATF